MDAVSGTTDDVQGDPATWRGGHGWSSDTIADLITGIGELIPTIAVISQ